MVLLIQPLGDTFLDRVYQAVVASRHLLLGVDYAKFVEHPPENPPDVIGVVTDADVMHLEVEEVGQMTGRRVVECGLRGVEECGLPKLASAVDETAAGSLRYIAALAFAAEERFGRNQSSCGEEGLRAGKRQRAVEQRPERAVRQRGEIQDQGFVNGDELNRVLNGPSAQPFPVCSPELAEVEDDRSCMGSGADQLNDRLARRGVPVESDFVAAARM